MAMPARERGQDEAAVPPAAATDDWLRCAMAHWLEDDASGAFARMRDGQRGIPR